MTYVAALQSEEVHFLKYHTLDTIQCADCAIDSADIREYFAAGEVLHGRVEKLRRGTFFSKYKKYSLDAQDSLYIVNYPIKSVNAPEGGYNTIFEFVNTTQGFKFKGTYYIP